MRFYAKLLAVGLLWLAAAGPARAEWLRAESPNFVLFGEVSEERIRAQALLLEDYAALLQLLTASPQRPSSSKLHVYLLRGIAALRQIRNVPSNAAGLYTATADGMGAFVDLSASNEWLSSNEVLLHEYAHHFLLQNNSRTYPAWFVEGFAEFMMTARFRPDTIEFGLPNPLRLRSIADRQSWLSTESLLFGGRPPRSMTDAFYGQSWLLTHYLFSDASRADQLNRYLAATNRGDPPRAAFEASFRMTPEQLFRELNRYAFASRLHYSSLPRASVSLSPAIEVSRLSGASDDLVLVQANIHVGTNRPAELLTRARRAASGRDSSFARRVLAAAEALHGDGEEAEQLIDALLAQRPDDAELLYLRGMRDLAAGRRDPARRGEHFGNARRWFARALERDVGHYQTLYRYAESQSDQPNFVSQNTANILLAAHRNAPQVSEIRLAAASMLLLREDYAGATALLRPLAAATHHDAAAAAAQALLAKAEAHDNAGVEIRFASPPTPGG